MGKNASRPHDDQPTFQTAKKQMVEQTIVLLLQL